LPTGLEEALIASLADAEGANPAAGAPPASKHAVKSLVREKLSGERLQQLGGAGTQCAVCRSAPFLLSCILLTTRYNSSAALSFADNKVQEQCGHVHACSTCTSHIKLRFGFMHVHGRHPPVPKLYLLWFIALVCTSCCTGICTMRPETCNKFAQSSPVRHN